MFVAAIVFIMIVRLHWFSTPVALTVAGVVLAFGFVLGPHITEKTAEIFKDLL